MKTAKEFTEALSKAAQELIAEGPSENRADRLELATRYLMCCSILSEMSWEHCKTLLMVPKTPYGIFTLDTPQGAEEPMIPKYPGIKHR